MAQRPPIAQDKPAINPAGDEAPIPPALQSLFGTRLRAARLAIGMTQAQLAAQCGMHVNYLTRVEQGKKNLTLGTMTKLADAVGGDVSDMLRKPDSPQEE